MSVVRKKYAQKREMNKQIVAPQVIDDIQYFVSNEGETGISISGLARLSGVKKQTIHRYLVSPENPSAYSVPKWLEPFKDKVFYRQLIGTQGEFIVTEEVSVACIEYYAYDSKDEKAKVTAQKSFRKFARKGFRNWVQELTGFAKEQDTNSLLTAVQELIGEVKELRHETKELKEEVADYKQIRWTTTTIFPGMDLCLDTFTKNVLPPEQVFITLAEWLKTKGITLDRSQMHRFANLVAETFRTMTQREPEKRLIPDKNGKGGSFLNVYYPNEYPLLEVSLKKLF